MNTQEAVARTLEDVEETLEIILGFLERDTAHLNDVLRVQEENVGGFPWEARDQAVTELMVATEGLKNRIRRIKEGGLGTP